MALSRPLKEDQLFSMMVLLLITVRLGKKSTAMETKTDSTFQEPLAEEEPSAEESKEEEEVTEDSKDKVVSQKPKQPAAMLGSLGDDLTLRAAMYGVLFQSYSDQVSAQDAVPVYVYVTPPPEMSRIATRSLLGLQTFFQRGCHVSLYVLILAFQQNQFLQSFLHLKNILVAHTENIHVTHFGR